MAELLPPGYPYGTEWTARPGPVPPNWRKLKLSGVDGEVFAVEFAVDSSWYADNAPRLVSEIPPCTRVAVPAADDAGLKHTFELHGLLSRDECAEIVAQSETLDFVRHSSGGGIASKLEQTGRRPPDKLAWVIPAEHSEALYRRMASQLPPDIHGWQPRAVNSRWRLYRYDAGFSLDRHLDRAYSASGLHTDGKLRHDVLQDGSASLLTLLIYLNDGVEDGGGGTTLYSFPRSRLPRRCNSGSDSDSGSDDDYNELTEVLPRAGDALAFPHGVNNPQSVWHAGAPLMKGTKYIIRTDIIYTPPATEQARYATIDPHLRPAAAAEAAAAVAAAEAAATASKQSEGATLSQGTMHAQQLAAGAELLAAAAAMQSAPRPERTKAELQSKLSATGRGADAIEGCAPVGKAVFMKTVSPHLSRK